MKTFFLAFMALFLFACDNNTVVAQDQSNVHDLTIISRDGKEHKFNVEIAITASEQRNGLMGRTQMDADKGMLFFFTEEGERGFWMKNTLIPLDMIFIKADGTIHRVHDSAKPNDLTSVKSQGPVSAVLELNGGTAKTLNIQAGDTVKNAFFE
jgi:uncharacterized membrane protein (UPF0127 family)